MIKERVLAAIAACVVVTSASAVQMYRWVDDRGVTNVSDAVPDRYRKTAVKVESTQFNVSPAQRRSSLVEAARRKGGSAASGPAAAAASAPTAASAPAGGIVAAAPVSPPPAGSECESLRQRYEASRACFEAGPKNQNGTNNAAKSAQCPEVVDPAPRCGWDPAKR